MNQMMENNHMKLQPDTATIKKSKPGEMRKTGITFQQRELNTQDIILQKAVYELN